MAGVITIHLHHCSPEDAAVLAIYLDEECWDWEGDDHALALVQRGKDEIEGCHLSRTVIHCASQ
jgi:hypothetical protein